jgi:hypothetical protein
MRRETAVEASERMQAGLGSEGAARLPESGAILGQEDLRAPDSERIVGEPPISRLGPGIWAV